MKIKTHCFISVFLRMLIILLFLSLFPGSGFSVNRLESADTIIKLEDYYFLESEYAEHAYVDGDKLDQGFEKYNWQRLPYARELPRYMYTFRTEFYIDEALHDVPLSIAAGASIYPYNLFVNGKVLAKAGRYKEAYNSVSFRSYDIFLPGELLNYGDTPNTFAFQIYPDRDTAPPPYIYLGGYARATSYTFWRNFLNVELIKAFTIIAIILFFFFVFLFISRQFETKHYLYFALTCLSFFFAYSNITFHYSSSNEVLLEWMTRASFPLTTFFLALFLMQFTGQFSSSRIIKIVLAVPTMAAAILPFTQHTKDTIKVVFGYSMNFVIMPILFFSIVVVVVTLVKKRRVRSVILILVSFTAIILASVYDVYHLNIGVAPFFWTIPYGYISMVLNIFFLLSIEQAKIYVASRERARELEIARKKLEKTNIAYDKFVPHLFLDLIERQNIFDLKLGDYIERDMTVLFSDIRSFAALSESMTPAENFNFINSFLKHIGPVIRSNSGFIDKYIGDGIMALFPQQAVNALDSALAISEELIYFNRSRINTNRPPVRIGIGINTGRLILGTIGEEERMEGTVISDSVNVASRMEELTKSYKVTIIFSSDTLKEIPNPGDYNYRYLGKVRVEGKSIDKKIFELIESDKLERNRLKIETREEFEEAVKLFEKKRFTAAKNKFYKVYQKNPKDYTASIFVKRCQNLIKRSGWTSDSKQ